MMTMAQDTSGTTKSTNTLLARVVVPKVETRHAPDALCSPTDCRGSSRIGVSRHFRRWWAGVANPVWSIVSSPNNGTNDELSGVSCASATSCEAVGYYYNTNEGLWQTVIESY